MEYLECRNTAGPCGCPEQVENIRGIILAYIAEQASFHFVDHQKRAAVSCRLPSRILTALRESERVCKMSNMVFSTRPFQSRCGNLVKVGDRAYKNINHSRA